MVWVTASRYEARWYDQEGNLLHTLPQPTRCQHGSNMRILAVTLFREQQVVLSCQECQCIWIGSNGLEAWRIGWQAAQWMGIKKKSGQPRPHSMCQGAPGQIIVYNLRQSHVKWEVANVSVFDIKQIPFKMVVPKIALGSRAFSPCDLRYCDLSGVGGVLAVLEGDWLHQLYMFSLDSGALLWKFGGWDNLGRRMKVDTVEWRPRGICTDNRGRLYVADSRNNGIIVFSAASGTVLQIVEGLGHYEISKDFMGRDKKRLVADVGIIVG